MHVMSDLRCSLGASVRFFERWVVIITGLTVVGKLRQVFGRGIRSRILGTKPS